MQSSCTNLLSWVLEATLMDRPMKKAAFLDPTWTTEQAVAAQAKSTAVNTSLPHPGSAELHATRTCQGDAPCQNEAQRELLPCGSTPLRAKAENSGGGDRQSTAPGLHHNCSHPKVAEIAVDESPAGP
jgi:hypothetical protein